MIDHRRIYIKLLWLQAPDPDDLEDNDLEDNDDDEVENILTAAESKNWKDSAIEPDASPTSPG